MVAMPKKNKGSLTVEATLILPIVLVSWLTIINFLNIYYMQICIQQALDNTAQELAQYSYLLQRTGKLDEVMSTLSTDVATQTTASELRQSLNGMRESIKKIGGAMENFSLSNAATIKDEVSNFVESAQSGFSSLSDVTPEKLKDLLISEAGNVTGGLALNGMVNSYLNDLGVKLDNVSNLTLSSSRLLYGDHQYITLVARYTYTNPLSIKFFSQKEMVQMVTVRPWIGADGTDLQKLCGN